MVASAIGRRERGRLWSSDVAAGVRTGVRRSVRERAGLCIVRSVPRLVRAITRGRDSRTLARSFPRW